MSGLASIDYVSALIIIPHMVSRIHATHFWANWCLNDEYPVGINGIIGSISIAKSFVPVYMSLSDLMYPSFRRKSQNGQPIFFDFQLEGRMYVELVESNMQRILFRVDRTHTVQA